MLRHEPSSRKSTIIINFRCDARDFARILLYWIRQGITFQSRSELIRATFERFIAESSIEEINSLRAGEILSEESGGYVKIGRQRDIQEIVERANKARATMIQERLKDREKEEKSFEDLLAGAPEEKEGEEKE